MPDLISSILRELGYVLLERTDKGSFVLLTDPPGWFTAIWGVVSSETGLPSISERSPFLDNFLLEAQSFWRSPSAHEFRSEAWIEQASRGEIPVQAIALSLDGKKVLALLSPEATFRDRGTILQAARDLVLAHEKLLREIQKKDVLLHCIIHDLSQPLSVMSGALDCLATEDISPRARHILELGKLASDQQISMIRQILQAFSEDVKATLDAEKNIGSAPDLLRVARDVITSFLPAFEAKQINILIDSGVDPKAPWTVVGEESRLRRVFCNLMENALRYAPPHSSVTVGMSSEGRSRRAWVDDEGKGLRPEVNPADIFSLFSKTKESTGKVGLGLYFCRVTVERWGGTIGCESLPQKGARFWFRLPAVAQETPVEPTNKPTPTAARPDSALRQPVRILLAEDQEEIRSVTVPQLEAEGHQVTVVCDGKCAVDAFLSDPFDVVLLDEEMPVMSGLEAVRAMRESEARGTAKFRRHSRIIALTGNYTSTDQHRLLEAGFDAVLGKPFRRDALYALLRDESSEVDSIPVRTRTDSGLSEAPFEREELLDRFGGDEKLMRQTVRLLWRDTPSRLRSIRQAIEHRNGDQLAFASHALKGCVAIFGANDAREAAEGLQNCGRSRQFQGANSLLELLEQEVAKLEQSLREYTETRAGNSSYPERKKTKRPRRRSER